MCFKKFDFSEQADVAKQLDEKFGAQPTRQTTSENLDDLISSVFQQGQPEQPKGNNNGPALQQPPLNKAPSKFSNNDGGCECVPYYQCQNGSILDNGVGLIDIR